MCLPTHPLPFLDSTIRAVLAMALLQEVGEKVPGMVVEGAVGSVPEGHPTRDFPRGIPGVPQNQSESFHVTFGGNFEAATVLPA